MEELIGIRGFIIDAPGFGSLRAYRNGALIIERGRIAAIGEYDDVRRSERGPKNALDRSWPERLRCSRG
jgi:imidazolonepropionase-like amidohydrolase